MELQSGVSQPVTLGPLTSIQLLSLECMFNDITSAAMPLTT
jgi:hypothetical protein